jgi:glycosyltransferase involved in cell wall biosynthesis
MRSFALGTPAPSDRRRERLRVAVVTSWPDDPRAPAGGVEAVSVNLVEALVPLEGLELHVVTTKRTYTSLARERWQEVYIHRLPWAGGSVLRHAVGPGRRQMQQYFATIAPDLIHAHDTYGLMVQGLALPRVFTIHGFIHGDTLVSGTRLARLRSRLWHRIETAGWADQPHIVSISPYVRERLTGIAHGVIHDIENPVAEAFFDITSNEHPGTIFSAAAITPRKNTLALVEAVADLVAKGLAVQLRLAGAANDTGYLRRVRERIEQKGLAGHVTLLGAIGSEQVRQELSAAAIFALVSLEENSPMGIAEAMAAAVPVVTSNRCGMPYMVRDGESGFLVDPHDPRDIAWRLGQLLENEELRRSLGDKGQEIARDRFHPAAVAQRTYAVYRRALNGTGRPSGPRHPGSGGQDRAEGKLHD